MALRVKNTLEKGGVLAALINAFNTLVTNCNASIGSVTGVNLLVADHNKAATDIGTIKTETDKVYDDLAALRTAFNTLVTKLNADEGVTDTNYAAAPALTSAAPIAATVVGTVADVEAGGITASETITLVD